MIPRVGDVPLHASGSRDAPCVAARTMFAKPEGSQALLAMGHTGLFHGHEGFVLEPSTSAPNALLTLASAGASVLDRRTGRIVRMPELEEALRRGFSVGRFVLVNTRLIGGSVRGEIIDQICRDVSRGNLAAETCLMLVRDRSLFLDVNAALVLKKLPSLKGDSFGHGKKARR